MKTYGYCKVCTYNNAKIKRQQTCVNKYGVNTVMNVPDFSSKCNKSTKYNFDLLSKIVKEHKITLLKDYTHEKISANYYIEGICSKENCLQHFSKPFCKLVNFNSYCKKCSIENAKIVRKNTNLTNIGVENYFQLNEIKEKIKYTNLQKYGVEHCMQNTEIAKKALLTGIRFKDYCFPSGRVEKIQGYEYIALDELIHIENIDDKDIIVGCKNVPVIWYKTPDGKQHRHYVDIFIPNQNRCIEVKSKGFYIRDKHILKLKKLAAEDLGYNYELWVYDNYKNKIFCDDICS